MVQPFQSEVEGAATEESISVHLASVENQFSANSSSTSPTTMSKSEIEDLREAFRLFDVDNRGIISLSDLREVANALALENGNKENARSTSSFRHLSDMLCNASFDDDDKELDEEAFVRLLSERHEDDSRDEYQRVFDLFDAKGKGYISVADLRKIAEDLGETMSNDELEEMISKAAPTSGKVTRDDFQKIMTKRLFS